MTEPKQNMKTGIELIAEERKEQIEKHLRTIQKDIEINSKGQLIEAACKLAPYSIVGYLGDYQEPSPPSGWSLTIWKRMLSKSHTERLIIAGALIAAEIDRLQNIDSL